MALGGDPVFNDPIDELYSSNDFRKAFRMIQSDPLFLGAGARMTL